MGNGRLLLGNGRLLLGNGRLLLGIIGVFGVFGISFLLLGGFGAPWVGGSVGVSKISKANSKVKEILLAKKAQVQGLQTFLWEPVPRALPARNPNRKSHKVETSQNQEWPQQTKPKKG